MVMARAQMSSQLKGNKMKKKPVQKKILGGMLTGGGKMGGIMPFAGIIPQMIYKNQKDKKKAANSEKEKGLAAAKRNRDIMQAAASRGQQPRQMKAGGKLNRADGCVVKGKTKGRMV